MKRVFLMKGFNKRSFRTFTPTPTIFLHKKAADGFCEMHSDNEIIYGYDEVLMSEAIDLKSWKEGRE